MDITNDNNNNNNGNKYFGIFIHLIVVCVFRLNPNKFMLTTIISQIKKPSGQNATSFD